MPQNMFKKNNFIWLILKFLLIIIFINILSKFFGVNSVLARKALDLVFYNTPIFLLLWHSISFLSPKRALFFITLAALAGWLLEVYGLRGGTFFGGHYVYHMGGVSIFDVPLLVVCYWAVFIYTGYCITNSFLYWLNKNKPQKKKKTKKNLKNFWQVPLLVLLDGWIVVAIDLFMDPLQVESGSWSWPAGGPYFGVPVGNFTGWFLVVVLVTGIFRIFEYFFPKKVSEDDRSFFIIPVLGYGALAISFAIDALKYEMVPLAIIGSLFMQSIVGLNVILFWRWRAKRPVKK